MLQIIAMLSMFIDHIGIVFFQNDDIMRSIGRIAFPIYAFMIVNGMKHTRNITNYMARIGLIGMIAQIPYHYVFKSGQINVLFTFFLSMIVLLVINRFKTKIKPTFFILLASVVILEVFPFEYGSYALILILIYAFMSGINIIISHVIINVIFYYFFGWIQSFSLLGSIIILLAMKSKQLQKRIVPKWVWQSFYPAHLAALSLLNF